MISKKDKTRVLALLGECVERAVGHGIPPREIRDAIEAALAKRAG
jgi:hypothetical protein